MLLNISIAQVTVNAKWCTACISYRLAALLFYIRLKFFYCTAFINRNLKFIINGKTSYTYQIYETMLILTLPEPLAGHCCILCLLSEI